MMFIGKIDVYDFAPYNTLWKSSPNLPVVLNSLEHDTSIVLNLLKANSKINFLSGIFSTIS